MSDTKYNGWTNYATWRVNLEVFDGLDPEMFDLTQEAYDLGKDLQACAEDCIFGSAYDERGRSSLMEDYARAFMQDVNWYEIAQHLIAEHVEA